MIAAPDMAQVAHGAASRADCRFPPAALFPAPERFVTGMGLFAEAAAVRADLFAIAAHDLVGIRS